MKFIEWCKEVLPIAKDIIPHSMIWAIILFHYGLGVLIVLLYLLDWFVKNGARSELLILLDKI